MTAGIGVPGFLGYEVSAPLPTLVQILDGAPPANSAPAVIATPGSSYHYSGGGYEIVEALMLEATGGAFPEAMDSLVLAPAGMAASTFVPLLPAGLETKAVSGHYVDGKELPGKWHVFPEHAAASLWSTPTDIANLLLLLGRSWRGESRLFLAPETTRLMFTAQNGGPYGFGAAIAESEGGGRHEARPECRLPSLFDAAARERSGPGGDDQLRQRLEACRSVNPSRRRAL
jgi:CubicO group peptidase (beta-lactamase class C family)